MFQCGALILQGLGSRRKAELSGIGQGVAKTIFRCLTADGVKSDRKDPCVLLEVGVLGIDGPAPRVSNLAYQRVHDGSHDTP